MESFDVGRMASSAAQSSCVYTTQLTKKVPKWLDGFTSISGSRVRLFDEDRKLLAEGACDLSVPHAVRLNEAYLIQIAEGGLDELAGKAKGDCQHPIPLTGVKAAYSASQFPTHLSLRGALSGTDESSEAPAVAKKRRPMGLLRRNPGVDPEGAAGLFRLASTTAGASSAPVEPAPHFFSTNERKAAGRCSDPPQFIVPAPHAASCVPMVRRPQNPPPSLSLQELRRAASTELAAPPTQMFTAASSGPSYQSLCDRAPAPTAVAALAAGIGPSGQSLCGLSPPVVDEDWWLFGGEPTAVPDLRPELLGATRGFIPTAANMLRVTGPDDDKPVPSCTAPLMDGNPGLARFDKTIPELKQRQMVAMPQPPPQSRWGSAGGALSARPSTANASHFMNADPAPASAVIGKPRRPPFLLRPLVAPSNSAAGLVIPGPSTCLKSRATQARLRCSQCQDGEATSCLAPTVLAEPCPSCFWRRVSLPLTYASPTAYACTLLRAMTQEVVVLLGASMEKFWTAASNAPHAAAGTGSFSGHMPAPSAGFELPRFQRQCRDAHVPFYATCELVRLDKKNRKQPAPKMSTRHGERPGEDSDDSNSQPRRGREKKRARSPPHVSGDVSSGTADPRFFLRFPKTDRESASAYSRDDLWIVSTSPQFGSVLPVEWPLACAAVEAPGRTAGSSDRARSAAGGWNSDFFAPSSAAAPFIWVARSAFHGPSQSDMIELLPLAAALRVRPASRLQQKPSRGLGPELDNEFFSSLSSLPPPAAFGSARSIRVCALRGPNVSSESAALNLLAQMYTLSTTDPSAFVARFPPLPFLANPSLPRDSSSNEVASSVQLGPPPAESVVSLAMTCPERDAMTEAVAAEFKLNKDQAAVLQAVAGALRCTRESDSPASSSPIVLVHGVFGAGKSQTLVALCVLLARLFDMSDKESDESAAMTAAPEQRERAALSAVGGTRRGVSETVIDLSDSDSSSGSASETGSIASALVREAVPMTSLASAATEKETHVPSGSPQSSILVAASTNAAVDRILLGLQAAGFLEFSRVGAVRKCAKAVLPHLLPYEDNPEARQSTLNDLRALLADPSCGGKDKEAVADAVNRLQVSATLET